MWYFFLVKVGQIDLFLWDVDWNGKVHTLMEFTGQGLIISKIPGYPGKKVVWYYLIKAGHSALGFLG